MKYLGKIQNQKDFVTKEYTDQKYTKPVEGIPATDLADDVQTSLGKADTALQEHQSLSAYRTSVAQDAIDAGKLNANSKGVAGGVAELDANGKVPVAQCPIEEDVAQAATDWLDEHIAQETGYVIDDSLTVPGAAADSKAVGDAINNIVIEVDDTLTEQGKAADAKAVGDEVGSLKSAVFGWVPVNLQVAVVQGALDSITGQTANANTWVRTMWFDATNTTYKIAPVSGYKIKAFYYTTPASGSDNFDHADDDFFTEEKLLEKGFYVRLGIKKTDNTSITTANGKRSFVSYEYKQLQDVNADLINVLYNSEIEEVFYKVGHNGQYISSINGESDANTTFARTDYVDVSNYEYLIYSNIRYDASITDFGMAFYTDTDVSTFLSGVSTDILATEVSYTQKILKVPTGAKYARFSLVKALDGFYIRGVRKSVLAGRYLSILGDSISAADSGNFNGTVSATSGRLYTPEGNELYYDGTHGNVINISDMWWKKLCTTTGMTPLVIDAWSGSSICYNYAQNDPRHDDTVRIPMCSELRTGRLSKDGHDPDIIIIAGGTNDWSYAAPATDSYRATTPIGNWDGHTGVNSADVFAGNSTFMESYAYLIKELQQNYPNAIILCASLYNIMRGTSNGMVRVNAVGNTIADYSDAIERVCKIMHVPFIDISNVGFNEQNYYPTYSQDSATTPTHLNPRGQAVIAKRYIEELPRLVKQFK